MNPFWDVVDAALVINLDQRTDRWQSAQATLAGIVPPGKLQRVPGIPGRELPGFGQRPWFRGRARDLTWAGRAGCTLGHKRALATAQQQGWQTALIMEDDIATSPDAGKVLAALAGYLRRRAEWDVCYLGFTDPLGPWRCLADLGDSQTLHQVYGLQCGHAYIVNATARDWLVAHMPDAGNVWPWIAHYGVSDRWYRRTMGRHCRVWAVSPGVVSQNAGFSDIAQRATDYNTGRHRLTVPVAHPSPASFALRLAARGLACACRDHYDAVRAIAKRLRGF